MSAAKNKAAAAIGRLGGKAKSERKAEAVRKNASAPPKPGKKPRGRPKKDNIQNRPIEHLISANATEHDAALVMLRDLRAALSHIELLKAANSDVRRIALERDRMRHALQKIEAESHDARAVDYAEAALR